MVFTPPRMTKGRIESAYYARNKLNVVRARGLMSEVADGRRLAYPSLPEDGSHDIRSTCFQRHSNAAVVADANLT